MESLHASIQRLAARLPELEWKLSTLGSVFSAKRLPPGLFHERLELTPQSCIEEIKAELHTVQQQDNERSARYLVERVSQKINILVRMCQMHANKPVSTRQESFGVRAISTRQQWLQTLQDDITRLTQQQQALLSTLDVVESGYSTQAMLSLHAELGEIDRRLTMAKETMARATRW